MPTWLQWSLLIVFAVHALAFGRLWWQRRTARHAVLTVTFLLLVTAFALRLAYTGGFPWYWIPRGAAWVGAAVSIFLWLRDRRRRARLYKPS